jgi:MFS family permease
MTGRFFQRPRVLYVTFFFWNAVVGGRFIAPFLKEQGAFSTTSDTIGDGLIGTILAFQLGLEALLGGWAGSLADALERKQKVQQNHHRGGGCCCCCCYYWCWCSGGRLLLIQLGIVLGCVVFLAYSLPIPWVWWQFFLRALFAIARSLTLPVLDGFTVAFLENESITSEGEERNGRKAYGQERLYGAIGWGIGALS